MRFVKQKFRHKPDQGIHGDCARTVIACLLDLDPDDVPHLQRECDAQEQADLHDRFLRDRGFCRITIPFQVERVADALGIGAHYSGDMPWLLVGRSRNDTNHVVICKGAEIVWDPALDDSGIVAPSDDGYFWIEWIVRPLSESEAA